MAKKNVKVRDLKPNKDAKGGGGTHLQAGGVPHGPSHASGGGPTHTASGGHGGAKGGI